MAMSRKKKIIIGSVAGVVLLAVVIGSILATRKDTPEVTVVKIETRPELRSTVTSSGEIRPIGSTAVASTITSPAPPTARAGAWAIRVHE